MAGPIVDAAQQQLLQEGLVHNRARLISASFLTKYLRIHWNQGERWYWEHLIDADLANNTLNWQWVAGTGLDNPYFRIFNPTIQMTKFDPDCHYIQKYLPSFTKLSAQEILAGIVPSDYPKQMIDLKLAREQTLALLKHHLMSYRDSQK